MSNLQFGTIVKNPDVANWNDIMVKLPPSVTLLKPTFVHCSVSRVGVILPFGEHLRHFFCFHLGEKQGLLASSGWRPIILLNILQST